MKLLKEFREKMGYTQEKLAEITGVDRSLISKYETGRAKPSPKVAKSIASILGFEWTLFYEPPANTKDVQAS